MPGVRTMVVAGVSGVLGAVLLAVLVLGRSEQRALLTLDQLQAEGGVVWLSVDSYERPPFELGAERPARTIQETWTVWEPGESPVAYLATRSIDGTHVSRVRAVGGEFTHYPTLTDSDIDWPRQGGGLVGVDAGFCEEGLEPMPAERTGSVLCVGPYPRPSGDRAPSAYFPAYPVDLDVESVRKEVRIDRDGATTSIIHRATTEDGSTVVIASLRFRTSYVTLVAWDEIRETVFGDAVGAG